jgi:catechol 2,3-dioxygenase-like lactoylglutathione lyase family enzyme
MTRTTPIRRVTIFCRDVEASLRCYRDLLGYSVIEDKRVEGKEIGRMLGLEECAMRILHLRSGDTPDGLIGLYAIQEGRPAELPRPPNLTSIHLGQSVIVVESNHLIEIEAGVKALGLPIVSELKSYVKTKPSAYLQVGTYKELIFLDPDGIAVNVVQFEPLNPQRDASLAAADLPY